jgi:hypothetical protein
MMTGMRGSGSAALVAVSQLRAIDDVFVPIGLIMPYYVIREVWQASDPDSGENWRRRERLHLARGLVAPRGDQWLRELLGRSIITGRHSLAEDMSTRFRGPVVLGWHEEFYRDICLGRFWES